MSPSRPIQIRFFALLREQAGCATLACESAATDPAALYTELQQRHPGLTFPSHLLRVSVNDRYATMDTPLAANDRVVFIPPVAGG